MVEHILQKIIGYQKAAELSFTGRIITSEEAYKLGLILKVVKQDIFYKEVIKLANSIAKKPANALRYLKRLLKMGSKLQLDEFLDFCALFQGISHNHPEHKMALKKIKTKK